MKNLIQDFDRRFGILYDDLKNDRTFRATSQSYAEAHGVSHNGFVRRMEEVLLCAPAEFVRDNFRATASGYEMTLAGAALVNAEINSRGSFDGRGVRIFWHPDAIIDALEDVRAIEDDRYEIVRCAFCGLGEWVDYDMPA